MITHAMENAHCDTLTAGVSTVLAAANALPRRELLQPELDIVQAASARKYFLPDEEEWVKLRYAQYLTLRSSLLATIHEIGSMAGRGQRDWESRAPLFATAFAAACILMRANRFIVDLATTHSVLWKKLDEEDARAGIPRKSFSTLYRALTAPRNQFRFWAASEYYFLYRDEIVRHATQSVAGPVLALLAEEEPFIEHRGKAVVKRSLAYRWFSFLRRNRSAWKIAMGGLFEASGRAIAELRQPGLKPAGSPKRIHPGLRAEILSLVRPGDVFITRHDDALSNWFLPGFWPHAALFLGDAAKAHFSFASPHCFLESKKDGVKLRPAAETLAVDALLVLRPPFAPDELSRGIERALSHCGKPYDFVFDFRTADRLVCTEVVYRGYHGIGRVKFHLHETGGRLCLPAEKLIDQALDCGFELILTAGVHRDCVLTGEPARSALHASRQSL